MFTTIRRAIRASPAALLAALAACGDKAPTGVALVGATVLDGTGGPPRADAVVVVRGARIEAIASKNGFALPDRTTQVDVTGKWIVPGLIDAHGHVAPWALNRYLAWGVTTVRDVHGAQDTILTLRQRAAASELDGPRIYSAGAMIDGRPTTYPDAIGVDDASDARKAVDRLSVAGVDFIKVYTRVDASLLRAIVDEANTFNLKVTGHLGLTDAITAAGIGVGAIEHLSGVPEAAGDAAGFYSAHYRGFWPGWTAFERGWAGLDSSALARVARDLAGQQIVLIPTLILHETFSRLDDPAITGHPELAAVPRAEQERWNVRGMIERAGWTAADLAAFRQGRPNQNRFLREFRRAGGVIAAGTDAANQLLTPGFSEHREMELLVEAGLTPSDALAAATTAGAALLGVDSLGVIAAGKAADLVVLAADPLADIRNTRRVERVMVRGRLLSADSIRKTW
ncbi:MAG TPA: amidohydrolase family protein [Gemmatimonadales bacterium]|nr:amidohydrolase family protein [Gemmatimonadales bacterium]